MAKMFFTFWMLICTSIVCAQGKFAGPLKNLIGRAYNDDNHKSWINSGYKFVEGSIISTSIAEKDTAMFFVNVYKKGNTIVAVFNHREVQNAPYHILDLIVINKAQPSWRLRTVDCNNGNEGATNILALIQISKSGSNKVLKAWRCDMDKIRFESMPVKLVHCEGEEQH
jgi:hypothetical protein